MSYRSFQHLLIGETNLERKCRFCFGLLILVLVPGSFFWYGQKTESLVRRQMTQTARMLVNPTLLNIHFNSLGDRNFAPIRDVLYGDLAVDGRSSRSSGASPQPVQRQGPKPSAQRRVRACATLARFVQAGAFADGSPTWAERITNGKKEFQYIQAVFFKPNCLMACHGEDNTQIDNHMYKPAHDGIHWVETKAGDLAGAVVVNLPMEQTYKAINSNRAILITAAMVTAILAMVSSYMIIRYVIIKPVTNLAVFDHLGGVRS